MSDKLASTRAKSGPKPKLSDPVTLTVRVERDTHRRAIALGSDGLRALLAEHLPR